MGNDVDTTAGNIPFCESKKDFNILPRESTSCWFWKKLLLLRSLAAPLTSFTEDQARWMVSKSGIFNAADTFNSICSKQRKVKGDRRLWFHIASQACLDCLDGCSGQITSSEMLHVTDTFCFLCEQAIEDRDHLFFGCPLSKQVWSKVLQCSGIIRSKGYWNSEFA